MTPEDQSNDLEWLAERLRREAPVPRAAFRSELRSALISEHARVARPPRLRLLIAGYGGAGSLLLVVATAGLAGLGPLAA